MIRITIERIEYQGMTAGELGMVHEYQPLGEHTERRRTLLLQEVDDGAIDVADVVALLNNLEPEPLCHCGHPGHAGECKVGSLMNQCRCRRYETRARKDQRELEESLRGNVSDANIRAVKAEGKLHAREQVIANQRHQVEKLTRSRDRLLSQKRKR